MAKFPTYEQMAKDVAEKALDEFLYDGKSIREWMIIIAKQKTGKWIEDPNDYFAWMCSECNSTLPVLYTHTGLRKYGKPHYKYCPNCGAKMEVEQ